MARLRRPATTGADRSGGRAAAGRRGAERGGEAAAGAARHPRGLRRGGWTRASDHGARMRSLGALGVLVFVLAGCGGPTSSVGAGGADIVPADAPAFVTIDTDLDSSQWQTIDQLASRFPDKDKLI